MEAANNSRLANLPGTSLYSGRRKVRHSGLRRRLSLRRVFAGLLLLMAIAACGSDTDSGSSTIPDPHPQRVGPGVDKDDATRAAETALADDRFEELLEARGSEVVEVRRSDPANRLDGLVVTLAFDTPLENQDDYPLDMCAIASEGPITGVVWLVVDGEISAVSPLWGAVACGY